MLHKTVSDHALLAVDAEVLKQVITKSSYTVTMRRAATIANIVKLLVAN